MNTSRLRELRNDLIRLQRSHRELETALKGFDAKQKERYEEKIRKQQFEIEETCCNAMQEIREIKAFLYPA
jgi:predicted transcriptional regulator